MGETDFFRDLLEAETVTERRDLLFLRINNMYEMYPSGEGDFEISNTMAKSEYLELFRRR